MLKVIWEERIVEEFQEMALGVSVVEGVKVSPRGGEFEGMLHRVELKVKSEHTLDGLKDVQAVRRYRDFFWRMDLDPTKNRPATEALIRRILSGRGLPKISNVVDAYNLASVETVITFSAFDYAKVNPPLTLRFAEENEDVLLIGMRKQALTGREVILADSNRILCIYAHADVEWTKVTSQTDNVLVVAYGAPGISLHEVEKGLSRAAEYILHFAGGKTVFKQVYICE